LCAAVAGNPALLVVLLNTFRFQRYLLVPERNAIHMVLHAEAQSRDMMQAYLQVRSGGVVCSLMCVCCVSWCFQPMQRHPHGAACGGAIA
jgi:uncharacterized protein (DUF2062 family)